MIVDFLCSCGSGEAIPGSDADDVAWVSAEQIDAYGVNEHAKAVILRGLQSSGTAQLAPAPEL